MQERLRISLHQEHHCASLIVSGTASGAAAPLDLWIPDADPL